MAVADPNGGNGLREKFMAVGNSYNKDGAIDVGLKDGFVLTKDPKRLAPIMRHVIADEVSLDEMPSNFNPVQISHAVTLFTDPHSFDMTKRHLHILRKIIIQYQNGFYLKDLVDLLIILNACADRTTEEEQRYLEPMIQIIKIAEKPFIKEKLSDDVAYKEVLKDTFAQFGFLLRIENEHLQSQICRTLFEIYCGEDDKNCGSKKKSSSSKKAGDESENKGRHQRISTEYNRYMLEQSGVAETLVRALAILQSAAVVNILFQLLRHLTCKSVINCSLVIESQGAHTICVQLPTVKDDVDRGLYLATEILWNLLEYGDSDAVTQQISNIECLTALHETFLKEIPKTYSKHNRTVRNDLLAIINLIAKTNPMAPFIEVGLVQTMLEVFTFTETRRKYNLTKSIRFSQSEEDFEFKRMLLAVLMNLSENPSISPLLKQFNLLPAMFHYVAPVPEKDPTWLPSQFEEIQLQCLASLPKLFPDLTSVFLEMNGFITISEFLNWCLAMDQNYKSQGNSVYATGGRGTKLAQTKYVLRFLKKMISQGEERLVSMVFESELQNKYITELSKKVAEMELIKVHDFTPPPSSLPPEAFITLDIVCEILYTLASLMENNSDQKVSIGKEGVGVLTSVLKLDERKVCLGLGYTRLILAALETIWCCVCGSYVNESYFLEQEGLFILLDLLEKQTKRSQTESATRAKNSSTSNETQYEESLKSVILGCLLDLLENPKTLSHMVTWTGKNDLKVGKLMVLLWKQDCGINDAETDSNSLFIEDIDRPLGSTDNSTEAKTVPRKSTEISFSISQVSSDLKPKIYGILTKVGFNEVAGLNSIDYVWLTKIERYFDFKISEVWKEIEEELKLEGITPIAQDKQALEAISRISKDRAENTMSNQKALYDAHEQQELSDENVAYSDIKATRKQQEKLKTDFNAYVLRTSNYNELVKAKNEQMASIDNSRSNMDIFKHPFFHTTTINNLNATVFASQNVTSDNLPLVIETQKPKTAQPTTAASSRKAAYFQT